MRSLETVPLQEWHLEDAASLSAARYRSLRQRVPSLPSRYEDADGMLSRLQELAAQAPGVAAVRGSRLVGFLVGLLLPAFRGKRAVLSPEWANAADPEGGRRIYGEMYTHLAARWAANGCFTHLIVMLAHDRDGIEGWHWLGFGLAAADAVRDLKPVQGPRGDIVIRRGGPQDIDQVMRLTEALQRHLAAPPTFLVCVEREDRASHEEWLADPANAVWLACEGTEVVGYVKQGPVTLNASDIIVDEGTTSIVGAFSKESVRGKGVATALLNRSLKWARSEGYERCAVDFEPMNVLAARFWTRHFEPVCYALVRHVDERIAWAHGEREASDVW
jgi:GNAT superfamily N-acetyltransferase